MPDGVRTPRRLGFLSEQGRFSGEQSSGDFADGDPVILRVLMVLCLVLQPLAAGVVRHGQACGQPAPASCCEARPCCGESVSGRCQCCGQTECGSGERDSCCAAQEASGPSSPSIPSHGCPDCPCCAVRTTSSQPVSAAPSRVQAHRVSTPAPERWSEVFTRATGCNLPVQFVVTPARAQDLRTRLALKCSWTT